MHLGFAPGIGWSTRCSRMAWAPGVRSMHKSHHPPKIGLGTALGRLDLGVGGLVEEGLDGGRNADGEVDQHHAADRKAGASKAADNSAVGNPVLARRRVDALDPKRTKGALAALAVAIGVLHR